MQGFISSKTYELRFSEEKNNENSYIEFQSVVKSQSVVEFQPVAKSQSVAKSQPVAEFQLVVSNLFVTKRHRQPPKRLKNALEDITSMHQNLHNSNNAVLDNNNMQERKKNKCAN
ncbi:36693_t:CDS:1, partial [Gigaspora margarita]